MEQRQPLLLLLSVKRKTSFMLQEEAGDEDLRTVVDDERIDEDANISIGDKIRSRNIL